MEPLCDGFGWRSDPMYDTCISDLVDSPARHGAYWLHPDGWYRLMPPPFDPHSLDAFDPSI